MVENVVITVSLQEPKELLDIESIFARRLLLNFSEVVDRCNAYQNAGTEYAARQWRGKNFG
jgi:hypothetical protein